ncbi:hypothetical protein CSA80_02835 [Candidatus Saccharibacteria bacterium]|nr:MAG: hypothetical protein CR973_02955 [Candidatus Saccharibacteria bacterium]PID99027.1 MAG: hypothetical protein CSA80_02835 [Candidatus Saccharibacteria bacterium]
MSNSIDTQHINRQLHTVVIALQKHIAILFFLVVTILYGFLLWRINVLSSAPPSQKDLSSASQTSPAPRISKEVVRTLQGLEDNSVRIQAIFNQARQSPFQE